MKKIIAIALVLVMVLGSFAEVFAASGNDNAVRLAKTEGTVAVKDANGVKKTIPENGKLLTGYVVATGKDGYAYITQGDKKLIKLDLNTTVSIKQGKNKKKIEVFLETGNIFVNVSEKLGSDEELNIKTTNTQTGVRGTMLEVSVVVTEISAPLENKLDGLGGVVKDREVSFGSPNDTGSSKGVSGESKGVSGEVNLASKQDALNSQNKQVGTNINLIEGFVTSSIFFPGVGLEGSSQQPAKIVNIAAGQSLNAQLDQGSNTNTVETGEFKLDELRGSTLSELLNIEPERLQTLEKVFTPTEGKTIVQQITEQAEKNTATDEAEAKQSDSNPLTIENNASSNQQNNQQVNNLYISNNSVDTGSGSGTPYVPPTYSVTLDLGQDGGRLKSDAGWTNNKQTGLASGTKVDLPALDKVEAPAGKEFVGWYTTSNFSGSSITSVTVGNTNQTVYAKYKVIEYTIKLNMNGYSFGSGFTTPAAITTDWTDKGTHYEKTGLNYGNQLTLPEIAMPTDSTTTKKFDGWYTEANGGTKLTSPVTVTADATYYAHFVDRQKYTITLNLNGGSLNSSLEDGWTTTSREFYDNEHVALTRPTSSQPDTYGLIGWFKEPECTNRVPNTVTVAESVTYYAKYGPYSDYRIILSVDYGDCPDLVTWGPDGPYWYKDRITGEGDITIPDPDLTAVNSDGECVEFIGWFIKDENNQETTWIPHSNVIPESETGTINLTARYRFKVTIGSNEQGAFDPSFFTGWTYSEDVANSKYTYSKFVSQDEKVYLPDRQPVSGKRFKRWMEGQNGYDGIFVTAYYPVELIAVYSPIHTVTLNMNGATLDQTTIRDYELVTNDGGLTYTLIGDETQTLYEAVVNIRPQKIVGQGTVVYKWQYNDTDINSGSSMYITQDIDIVAVEDAPQPT